jgi:hypothetical protein
MRSTIKQKTGKCTACGRNGPLITDKCNTCYWQHRAKENAGRTTRPRYDISNQQDDQPQGKTMSEWFLERRAEMVGVCCNCGNKTAKHSDAFFVFSIAHILPKSRNSGFPSVGQHPDNWFELCMNCHTAYDSSWATAAKMPCFAIALKKFKRFGHLIAIPERRRIPEYFLK